MAREGVLQLCRKAACGDGQGTASLSPTGVVCIAPVWGKFIRTFNRHELSSATALLRASQVQRAGVRPRHDFQRESWALDCIFS